MIHPNDHAAGNTPFDRFPFDFQAYEQQSVLCCLNIESRHCFAAISIRLRRMKNRNEIEKKQRVCAARHLKDTHGASRSAMQNTYNKYTIFTEDCQADFAEESSFFPLL